MPDDPIAGTIVGHITSSLGHKVTIHYKADEKKISFTAASNHWGLSTPEGETLSRVVGFLVVMGLDSNLIFHAEGFKKDHRRFQCELPAPPAATAAAPATPATPGA